MNKPCTQHIEESKIQLKTGGLKITSARLNLLDILKHAKKPMSIKDISRRLTESDMDLVTLYRNVESLQNLGVVKQVNLKDRRVYYELSGGEHHHHLICTNCGRLEDIQVQEVKLNKTFLKNHGFVKVTDHSLEFFGLCNKCSSIGRR